MGNRVGARRAAALAGLVLVGIPASLTLGLLALFTTLFPQMAANPDDQMLFWLLTLGSLLFGVFAFGLLAFFGGCVIDYARRRELSPVLSTALIGLVLFDCVGLYLTGWNWANIVPLSSFPSKDDVTDTGSTMLACIGWAFGLLVSGFPEALRLCRGFTLPVRRPSPRAAEPQAAPAKP